MAKKEKKDIKKGSVEKVDDKGEHVVEIFETKATEIENEALRIHNETVTKLLSEMREGYRKELKNMVKDLASVKEEGLSGLLTKTNDIKVEEIENNQDKKTELEITLGTKTQVISMKPLTKYKIFLIAVPTGKAEPKPEAPAEAPAPEAPAAEAPAEAPAPEAPAEAPPA